MVCIGHIKETSSHPRPPSSTKGTSKTGCSPTKAVLVTSKSVLSVGINRTEVFLPTGARRTRGRLARGGRISCPSSAIILFIFKRKNNSVMLLINQYPKKAISSQTLENKIDKKEKKFVIYVKSRFEIVNQDVKYITLLIEKYKV
jgi:hypothetical protein